MRVIVKCKENETTRILVNDKWIEAPEPIVELFAFHATVLEKDKPDELTMDYNGPPALYMIKRVYSEKMKVVERWEVATRKQYNAWPFTKQKLELNQ